MKRCFIYIKEGCIFKWTAANNCRLLNYCNYRLLSDVPSAAGVSGFILVTATCQRSPRAPNTTMSQVLENGYKLIWIVRLSHYIREEGRYRHIVIKWDKISVAKIMLITMYSKEGHHTMRYNNNDHLIIILLMGLLMVVK